MSFMISFTKEDGNSVSIRADTITAVQKISIDIMAIHTTDDIFRVRATGGYGNIVNTIKNTLNNIFISRLRELELDSEFREAMKYAFSKMHTRLAPDRYIVDAYTKEIAEAVKRQLAKKMTETPYYGYKAYSTDHIKYFKEQYSIPEKRDPHEGLLSPFGLVYEPTITKASRITLKEYLAKQESYVKGKPDKKDEKK